VRSKLCHKSALLRLIDANRAQLEQFVPWVNTVKNDVQMSRWLQRMEADWADEKRFDYLIFVQPPANASGAEKVKVLVGNIACMNVDGSESCELGFWISPAYEGKGLMSEALALVEEMIFRSKRVRQLAIKCDARNDRCKQFAQRHDYICSDDLTRKRFLSSSRTWEEAETYIKEISET